LIGPVYLPELKSPQIQRLVNTLSAGDKATGRKPLAPKTVTCVYGILHRALKQAKSIKLIPENPAEEINLPKIKKPELNPLMDDSLTAFLKAIQGSQFERIYLVALFTGLRQSEIIGLQWCDIDWENGLITVTRQRQRVIKGNGGYRMVDSSKNGSFRKVTAAPSVLKVLKAERRQQAINRLAAGKYWDNPDDFIFTDVLGTPVKHEAVYREFKKMVKSIGMDHTRFHDLRHSYAINAIAGGDNIKSVSDNLGHYSAAFTMDVYGDTSKAMRKQSADVIEQIIKDASGE
jgi:integrase